MAELLITSSLDPIEEGQVFDVLPRHVTIRQYFSLPDVYLGAFTNQVSRIVEGFSPFEILGADEAMYGENLDTPVRRVMMLGSGATLITLHAVLSPVIERFIGEVRNPEWADAGFNPHITYVGGRALDAAEYAKLTTVELIEKKSEGKVVRSVWDLKE